MFQKNRVLTFGLLYFLVCYMNVVLETCSKSYSQVFQLDFSFSIVTLGFFDDIQIPAASLQHPSRFDEEEQVWIWEYENQGSSHSLFMDVGQLLLKILTLFYTKSSCDTNSYSIIQQYKPSVGPFKQY